MGISAYLYPCLWMTLSLSMSLQSVCAYVKWAQSGFKRNMYPGLCMYWCECVHVCVHVWGGRNRETERQRECLPILCVRDPCVPIFVWVCICLSGYVLVSSISSVSFSVSAFWVYQHLHVHERLGCVVGYICVSMCLFFTIHPSTHLFISIALTFTGYLVIALRQITKFLLHLSFLIYKMETISIW